MIEGEKHHFKIKVAQIGTILNPCANRKTTHKNHVGGA
jgi:hypothetical protein